MYSQKLTKVNSRQPAPSRHPEMTWKNTPIGPATAAGQVTSTAKSTPVQFSVSMLLALMNAQPENQQPGGTSVTVSSDQVTL
jgi:hypothetical protein